MMVALLPPQRGGTFAARGGAKAKGGIGAQG